MAQVDAQFAACLLSMIVEVLAPYLSHRKGVRIWSDPRFWRQNLEITSWDEVDVSGFCGTQARFMRLKKTLHYAINAFCVLWHLLPLARLPPLSECTPFASRSIGDREVHDQIGWRLTVLSPQVTVMPVTTLFSDGPGLRWR